MSWVKKVRNLVKKFSSKNVTDIINTIHILVLDFEKRWNYIEKHKNMIPVGSRLEKSIFNIVKSYEQDILQVIDEVNNAILKIIYKHKVERVQLLAIDALGYIKGGTAFKHLMKMYKSRSLNEEAHIRVELAIGLIDFLALLSNCKDKSKEHFDYLTRSISSKNWLFDLHYTLCGYAYEFYKKGKYEDMVTVLELAIELSPRIDRAYHHIGLHYNSQQEWTKAIPYLEKAYSLIDDKDDEAINNSLGNAYLRLKQGEKAVKHFRKLIEIKPKFDLYWLNLSCSYIQVKDLENAEKCARKASKLEPGFETARDLLNMTIELQKSIKQNPDDKSVLDLIDEISKTI